MKRTWVHWTIVVVCTVSTATSALAQKAGQSSRITTGNVERAERVQLSSETGKGALVGGTLGLASASGKSSSKKARNSLIGGIAGGALRSSAQGSREGMAYTVRGVDGSSVRIVTDQTEVRVGDCVTVEETGQTANIRRASQTLCDPASAKAREAVQSELQEEAAECAQAKHELVNASTVEAFDVAKRKVDILCSD